MKAVLPLIPNAAPGASPEAGAPREAVGDGETFASVLDRRNPATHPRVGNGDATRVESEVADTEATDPPGHVEEGEVEETPIPLPAPTLDLPTLPYHPLQEPRIPWNPIASAALPVEAGEVNSAAAADAGIFAPENHPRASRVATNHAADAGSSGTEKPAQYAATISAGQGQSLPILTAMFPIPMAQLQAQLRAWTGSPTRETSLPVATAELRAATLPTVAEGSPLPGFVPEPTDALPTMPGEFAPALPRAPYIGSVTLPDASERSPQRTPATASFTPVPQREIPDFNTTREGASTQREIPGFTTIREGALPQRDDPARAIAAFTDPAEVAPARAPVPAPAAVETSLLERAPQPHGTSAAKGGEVMQAIAFQAPPKPRVAKSADPLVASLESTEPAPAVGIGQSPASSGIQATAPAPTADAMTRKTPEHRFAEDSRIELREAPTAGVQASAGSQVESGVPHSSGGQAATTVETAGRKESEHQPGADPRVELDAQVPAHFQAVRPQADRVTTEAVPPEAPISRAEVVQIVERTADAAVRMRATGSERIEVAVQLENGDRLSIQLRIANGEVTPYFRTSSEGLRTALEQNWTQFSDRANDRGVRLTPPVFDVNQSSSNMTDLSQQRHGRDPAYTDAQAELFPHLPRRMRPPRVLASAPLESSSATTAGVRTYA